MKSLRLVHILFMAITLACPNAWADEGTGPWEKLSLYAGIFATQMDSTVQLSGPKNIVGVNVDVEKVLGLDKDVNVFRFDGIWRISGRHRLDFGFFDLSRDAVYTIGREITILDNTYFIGTTLDTELTMRMYKAAYTYDFTKNENFEIGASIGAYIGDVGLEIREVGQPTIASEYITAPLPFIGLRATFALTPKLFLRQSIELFYLDLSDYRGSLIDLNIGLEYNLLSHFGLGVGYDIMNIRLSGNSDDDVLNGGLNGDIDIRWQGVQLYGKLYF